ncbi:MAG: NUDIX domain-containing protein [Chloroflexota bacterium]
MSKPIKKKVFAYITQKDKLLVFEHTQHPEAGIQVPAGTLEVDETPQEGALREAREESGLQKLTVIRFLGEQVRDMSDYGKNEIHHRYFYHLLCEEDTPDIWLHHELYSSEESGITHEFRFYWVEIANPPQLIADHDYYIDKLTSSK